jgi:HNH endonuclease
MSDDVRYVPLANGKGAAKVDASDWRLVSAFKWKLSTKGYASRNVGGRDRRVTVFMHRFITGPHLSQQIDHINGDRLDNRRTNLRVCTSRQNQANRRNGTGRRFKGVSQRGNRFRARIGGRHIGTFDNEFDAAVAYDRAAVQEFGAFARLNVPWLTMKSA